MYPIAHANKNACRKYHSIGVVFTLILPQGTVVIIKVAIETINIPIGVLMNSSMNNTTRMAPIIARIFAIFKPATLHQFLNFLNVFLLIILFVFFVKYICILKCMKVNKIGVTYIATYFSQTH